MTRIDRHLDKMFYAFPSSPEARAMKENLRRDALEKLEELQNEGLSPQQAQQRVLEELGDGAELEELLPRTNTTQKWAFVISCFLALILLGTAAVYDLFFRRQMLLNFDLRFQGISSFLLLPFGLMALGYALGYPIKKHWLRTIPYGASKGLLILGAAFPCAYLLLLVLFLCSIQPADYILLYLVRGNILFFGAGVFLSLGIN